MLYNFKVLPLMEVFLFKINLKVFVQFVNFHYAISKSSASLVRVGNG